MRIKVPGLLVVSLMLASCGGGGSNTNTQTPPPPQPPTVTTTSPASSTTGVAVTAAVTATFSTAMNASSITGSTFTVTGTSGAVAGTVTYSTASNTATFTPNASLSYSSQYTATITTGATNSSGTALATNYSWTFTTAAAPSPTVTGVTPTTGSTGVAITTTVTATFGTAMSASTITASTFTLTPQGGSAISATVNYASSVATLTPNSPLAYNTQYTATITTGVQSSQGTALAANYTWTFTTATAPPAPTVTGVMPTSGATGIAVATAITATFSQPMNSASITGSTFTLAGPSGAVAGAVSYSSATQTASFDPAANLAYGTTYTATITTGATGTAGTALAANYTWSFTTVAVPTVAATQPTNGATGISLSQNLTATFSQQMNSSTITASTFTLAVTGGAAVAGLVSYNSTTAIATFTPSATLTDGTSYTATITTGATSAAGVALASNYTWTFTTVANANQVTVDFGTTYQKIRGFGGSTAWLGQMPQAVATALFSPTSGLGLSMLRLRIDPEGSATGGGIHGLPYETSEWDYEAANGLEAVTANPNAVVFASPWTPPAAWKLNGSSSVQDDGETWNQSFNTCSEGTGYCGGYLDPNHYADYANYLEDFVKFFNSTDGFNLYAISMQNEPEENVTYESCVWTPEEMDAWIAGDASTITSDTYHTKLIMPESNDFNPVDAATTLNDANAQGLVSIIGGHIYQILFSGSIGPYSIPSGDSPKELWMTEFGPLSTATPTWNVALTTYAESIHNSMVTGQYNAYVWWGIFGAPTAAGTWGLVDSSGNPTVMGDVVGQYSKFIQPGYVRASATANPIAGVYVSAYLNASPSHYVIVAINANSTSENLTFAVNNGTVTSLTPYQSTSAGGLMPQSAVSVSGGQFSYSLPAQSIVTFVQ